MNRLIVECPGLKAAADGPLHFKQVDGSGRVMREGQAALTGMPKDQPVDLILPATDVLLTTLKLPALSGARLQAALPHALEDNVLSEVETLFVALGPKLADGQHVVAAVERIPLQRWLRACDAAGLRLHAVYPESLCRPATAQHWFAQLGPAGGWLQTEPARALSLSPTSDPTQVPVELSLTLARAAVRPERLSVTGPVNHAAWSSALGLPVQAATETGVATPALNLLQFDLAPQTLDWKAWRWPLRFALAAAVIGALGLNVQAWRLSSEQKALRARMEAAYRQAFPGPGVLVNPVQQMRRNLAELRAAAGGDNPHDFIAAVNAVGSAAEPDAVEKLEYRDGTLKLLWRPKRMADPEQKALFQQRLKGMGWTVREQDGATLIARSTP